MTACIGRAFPARCDRMNIEPGLYNRIGALDQPARSHCQRTASGSNPQDSAMKGRTATALLQTTKAIGE